MTMFERDDWMLFRSLGTIGQKAGVELDLLRRLVLKELADNALDAGANCTVRELRAGETYQVVDDGPGIPSEPDDVAKLFSIRRPLTSSKLLRKPTRGAVGNGLRVVAGAVLASGGELTVWTRNRVHRLMPRHDGTTAVEWEAADRPTGTRVEVTFGDSVPADDDALLWARQAIAFGTDNIYHRNTSAYWFDAESFYELCLSAGDLTVRKLVELFEGCTGRKAGKLAANFHQRRANELMRVEAVALLEAIRKASKPVMAKRLGRIGKEKLEGAYACERGWFEQRAGRGGPPAKIPFVVEAWAEPSDDIELTLAINRTPIASDLSIYRHSFDKNNYTVHGCGLLTEFKVGQPRRGDFKLVANVTTPYMPITTDGKTPDLSVVRAALLKALASATKRAKRRNKSAGDKGQQFQNAFIRAQLDEAIQDAGGRHRPSQRQVYYSMNAIHEKIGAGEKPSWEWFCKVLTTIEAERGGDLPLYRDDRGILYHPHTSEYIPLGTRNVERYRRPEWLFHKVLYIEKEGFIAALIEDGWPRQSHLISR